MPKKIIKAQQFNIDKNLISHDALYVIEKLQQHNFEAYIVGGGIRDLLINKIPKDFDIVTNAIPETIRSIFKRHSIIIGRRFKIVHVNFENINPDKMVNNRPILEYHTIEVSTYRSLKVQKKSLSEHGRIMFDNNYGSQKEDATRRDFTVNALFYDPIKEVIIDYHNGLDDIKNKIICTIGDPTSRYIEDPVRILRAIRLAIKLNFKIAPSSKKPFDELKSLLLNESRGRMYEEMIKILLSGYSVKCIKTLLKLGIPKGVFPLFDKVFFSSNPDQLAHNILIKTDNRLNETNDISLNFILAGMLWNLVYNDWQKQIMHQSLSIKQSLEQSIHQLRSFMYNIGITKGVIANITQVWLLQFDLEYPRHPIQTFNQSRFRQAWHLFSSRYEVGQIDEAQYQWWSKFIESDADAQMLMAQDIKPTTKNKKRKRNRKVKKINFEK